MTGNPSVRVFDYLIKCGTRASRKAINILIERILGAAHPIKLVRQKSGLNDYGVRCGVVFDYLICNDRNGKAISISSKAVDFVGGGIFHAIMGIPGRGKNCGLNRDSVRCRVVFDYFIYGSSVVSAETIYVNGENNQSKKIYYTNGKLYQEVKLVNGYLAGDWKMYHPNGILAEVRTYDDQGRQTGIVYYDEKGQIVTDGLWQGHTQDGKISGPYQIKNGKRADGLWVPEVSHEKVSQGQLAPGAVRLKSGKVLEGEIIEKTGDTIKLKKGDEIKSIPFNMLDKESIDLIKGKEN